MLDFVSLTSLLKTSPHAAGAEKSGEPEGVSPRTKLSVVPSGGLRPPARLSGVAWRAITVAFLIALPSSAARADDTVGLKFFREKIEPVLKAQCYACHSRQAEEVQGGLRLDFKAGVLRGGDSGHLNEFIYFR